MAETTAVAWGGVTTIRINNEETFMPALFALATSVGLLAIVATWLFLFFSPLTSLHAQVWIVFIAWGAHYHCGGKLSGTRDAIVCMSFGALIGMLSVMLAGWIPVSDQIAVSIAVGVGATVIVLSSSFKYLAAIPASVYGFASIAGIWILGGPTLLGSEHVSSALLPTIISIIGGGIFGIVSEKVAGVVEQT
jgi:hypothetical protein